MPDGITTTPGATFYPRLEWPTSGLAGTIGVRILKDSDGSTVLARATAGITEVPSGSGQYVATLVAPTTAGEYTVFWDDGSVTPGHVASEDLQVLYSSVSVAAPSGTDLCTVADVKQAQESSIVSTALDALIQTYITQASTILPERYQRDFAPRTGTETFMVDSYRVDFAPYDLNTPTTVTLHPEGTGVVLTRDVGYQLLPIGQTEVLGTYNGMQLSGLQSVYSTNSTRFGYEQVSILGTWGPTGVPNDIRRAAVITVMSWLDRGWSQYNLPTVEPMRDLRPEMFGGWPIPPQAHAILRPYQRAMIG